MRLDILSILIILVIPSQPSKNELIIHFNCWKLIWMIYFEMEEKEKKRIYK